MLDFVFKRDRRDRDDTNIICLTTNTKRNIPATINSNQKCYFAKDGKCTLKNVLIKDGRCYSSFTNYEKGEFIK